MVVAVSTVVLDGLDLRRGAEILSSLGVAEVEVAYIDGYMSFDESTFTDRVGREVASQFAGFGVGMRAVSAHSDLGREDGADRLLRRLDFATGAGVDTIISNATSYAGRRALMQALEIALPRFQSAGVVLALENPGHGNGALIPDGRAGASFVAGWDSPWLRMNYDVGNAYTYACGDIDLTADLTAALPFARRLHLKDVRATGEDWHFCSLGSGSVGYGKTVPWSRLVGPDITLEHPIRLWRPGRGDPMRRPDIPDEQAIRAAISASLDALRGEVPS